MVIFHSYVSLPEGIYCPYILSPWYHRDTQLYRPAFLLLFIAEFTSISMLPQNLFMVIPPFITIVIPNYSSIYIYIWIHINIYIYLLYTVYIYIYIYIYMLYPNSRFFYSAPTGLKPRSATRDPLGGHRRPAPLRSYFAPRGNQWILMVLDTI